MRNTIFALVALCVMAGFAGCGEGKPGSTSGGDSLRVDTSQVAERDSTVYGTSDEFGMSTFTLITDGGDTLYLDRDGADGSMAHIYGDLDEGVRYGVTTRDGGKSLATAVNVSQLERFVPDYALFNGRLVLTEDGRRDTVQFVALDDAGLTVMRADSSLLHLSGARS